MANTSLTRTFDQVGNRTTWTLSVWIKRTGIGGQQNFFGSFPQSTDYERIMFNNDKIYIAEVAGGSTNWECETNAVYRDVASWYHLVLRHDTTQSTANDRIRLYINGVQQTFGTNSQPAQNRGTAINTADVHKIGMGNSSEYTDCIMSHFHWCDGQSYAPTVFGSTDATTGEWKINTSPTVSYGTNGFFILKDGNSVTDQGGGSHNWTVASGTLSKTEDCPSNVFATLNVLNQNTTNAITFEKGSNTIATAASATMFHGSSTLGMPQNSGKFYAEFKWTSGSYPIAGVTSRARNDARESGGKRPGGENGSYGFEMYNGGVKVNSSTIGGFSGSSLTTNDILCIAIDCENSKIYFRKNGDAWMNSGDPTSGSTGTGAISLTAASGGDNDGFWFFVNGDGDASSSSLIACNFGNGSFNGTAVSSAGTNASNNGEFEYDVPAGYTALSTKGLNL